MNYRSSKEIVDLFVAFSRDMIASRDSLDLSLDLSLVSHRGASGARPDFRVAAKTDDELASVAAGIEERRRAGTEYRDQAVLCVSNSRLNEMAAGLEERGIPVLHLEDLFDRQETKTLLSILTLFQDPFAIRLLTMAQVPKFEMNLEDVTLVMDSLRS